MIHILEATIAILILLIPTLFLNFQGKAYFNETLVRHLVYNEPIKLKSIYSYVRVYYFCNKFNNISYGNGYPKIAYLFVGNETIYCPALVLLG